MGKSFKHSANTLHRQNAKVNLQVSERHKVNQYFIFIYLDLIKVLVMDGDLPHKIRRPNSVIAALAEMLILKPSHVKQIFAFST